jgi:glycosyltransferase involved in cell wall biosynthesis
MFSHLASPVSPTGAERSLALLARGLAARGHAVRVVTPGRWALEDELQAAGVPTRRIAARVCWLAYHEPRAWPTALARWGRFALPDPGARRLRRDLRAAPADLAYVNCLPHLRAARAACAAGLPVVWHVREILPGGLRRRWFTQRLAAWSRSIVAVSEAVGAWIRDEGLHGRVEVIHNGVEQRPDPAPDPVAARRSLGIPEDGCVVGLFGQLRPHKGAGAFVEAAAAALPRQRALRFVIAGSGPQGFRERIARQIRERGLADRVHLLSAQPSSAGLCAAADVVALASLTPDPLPRTVLEAMAWGLPVVAFRSGGAPEMVQHEETGLLVPCGDVAALAAAFVRLGGDPALRRRLGRGGLRRMRERFTLDRHLDRMEELFLRVARG